ncbi:MAG TPA: UDP-N-acetylglucosamine 2-epimerase (hydrolyzing) [Sneathiellales bacterium]|nr:UDP-N-acetylglucosamine 2-epimerase (hydrolyzing) [Sneathiellales bacterium]
MRKICVVITARPSYSRVRSLLQAIKDHSELELQLVVAASALLDRYGATDKVIEQEGFTIDRRVYMIVEGENLVTSAKSTGFGLAELATVFDDLKPDVVVTIADRFETMATAVAASYINIPLAHVQGGEVTGSIDEKVRHSVTKLADLHFVASEQAAGRVIRMGERPETVHITGCPSIDVAKQALANPDPGFDVFERYTGVGPRFLLDDGYVVVMQHPVTTEHGESRQYVEETLHAIHDCGVPTLWFWPNVDAGSDGTSSGIRAFRENHRPDKMHFFKSLAPEDFLRVLHGAKCIVGNSSVAIRECAYLGVPAVNIGSRQGGRDRGRNVVDVNYDRGEIRAAIEEHVGNGHMTPDMLYGDGSAGLKIAGLLATVDLNIDKRLAY